MNTLPFLMCIERVVPVSDFDIAHLIVLRCKLMCCISSTVLTCFVNSQGTAEIKQGVDMASADADSAALTPASMPEPSKRNHSASLRRALEVLDFLAGPGVDSAGATLAELCQGTGLNKSTALRLLGPLAEARLVRQSLDTRRWSLGPQTAYLGQMFLERLDLPSMARPSLKRLSRLTGETAHMVVLEGTQVCYVDKVEATDSSVRMISRIGARQPLYCTGVGKCFLAYSDGALLERVVHEGLVAKTDRTITKPEELRLELAQIRASGYAVDDVENEAHIRCVAAPIFQADGQICAALSVAGPTNRVTLERVNDLAAYVRSAADEVTQQLGGKMDAPNPQDDARTPKTPPGRSLDE